MCLAVPARILRRWDAALPMAEVRFGAAAREICLAFVPEAAVGDFVVVHAGYATRRLDREQAEALLRLLGAPVSSGHPQAPSRRSRSRT